MNIPVFSLDCRSHRSDTVEHLSLRVNKTWLQAVLYVSRVGAKSQDRKLSFGV
jgi:hypothetical protein